MTATLRSLTKHTLLQTISTSGNKITDFDRWWKWTIYLLGKSGESFESTTRKILLNVLYPNSNNTVHAGVKYEITDPLTIEYHNYGKPNSTK